MRLVRQKPGAWPYQLVGPEYAIRTATGVVLGMAAQAALDHYLCGGARIAYTHNRAPLDELSKLVIIQLAAARGVLIPHQAFA